MSVHSLVVWKVNFRDRQAGRQTETHRQKDSKRETHTHMHVTTTTTYICSDLLQRTYLVF